MADDEYTLPPKRRIVSFRERITEHYQSALASVREDWPKRHSEPNRHRSHPQFEPEDSIRSYIRMMVHWARERRAWLDYLDSMETFRNLVAHIDVRKLNTLIDYLENYEILCAHCDENLAQCIGKYDNMASAAPACSECCGCGCEDGYCVPIDGMSSLTVFLQDILEWVEWAKTTPTQ